MTRVASLLIGGIALACMGNGGNECVVFFEQTPVFAAMQPDSKLREGDPPAGPEIGKFEAGQETRVLWASNFKDQIVYRIVLREGAEGLIYYGRGKFSDPQACKAR